MSTNRDRSSPARQRGAATLAIVGLLVFALLLVVAWTQKQVVVEARASANGLRTAQAFEAAEAGVEWTLARLNDDAPIGTDCRPSGDAADATFRESRVALDVASGRLGPATWLDGGVATAPAAACVRDGAGWRCHCPVAAHPAVAAGDTIAPAPSFVARIEAGAAPGVLRIVSTGCLRADAACSAEADRGHEASARIELQVALLPALRQAPAAAIVAGGDVDAGVAPLLVANRDGAALHVGGGVSGDAIRLAGPAGSGLGDSIAAGDAGLAALDADRFFARWFGMSRAAWRGQPAATVVRCDGDCSAPIAAAVAAGSRLIAIAGDGEIAGPIRLGSAARPIALAADGALRLRGDVVVHGVVAAGSLDWRGATPASAVHGALLLHRDLRSDGAATIDRDPAVIAALRRSAGSIVRIDGSWKDF